MAFASNNEVHIFFSYVFLSGGNYFPMETTNSGTIRFPLLVRKKTKSFKPQQYEEYKEGAALYRDLLFTRQY